MYERTHQIWRKCAHPIKFINLLFMSTIFRLSFFALLLMLTSCSDITEEVWIQADGSGRQEYQFDLSSMYPFIGMSLENNPALQSDRPDTLSEKDRMALGMAKLLSREKLDTVISMQALFAQLGASKGLTMEDIMQKLEEKSAEGETEMTPKQRAAIRQMMNLLMGIDFRLQSDREKAKLNFAMVSRFTDTDSTLAKSMVDMMKNMSEELGEQLPPGVGNIEQMFAGNINYDLNKNTLHVKRNAYVMPKIEDEENPLGSSMEMMKAFMGQINYRVVIHLPGKVRKVSGAEAEIDGDKVTLVIPYTDMMDPEKDWDISIKFRKP